MKLQVKGHIDNMGKVTNLRRIKKDDFDSEYEDIVQTLATSINPFLEQVMAALNKNIDFDNLNQQYSTFEAEVDAFGVPITKIEIKYELKTIIKGCFVIAVDNLENGALLTGAPFVSFNVVQGGISIKQITGLPANTTFRISMVLIG